MGAPWTPRTPAYGQRGRRVQPRVAAAPLRCVRISLRIRSRRGSRGGVDVGHRRGDRGVDRGDPLVHRLGDGAVGGVALAAGAQLAEVHRLAGVQVEHVADPVAEAERVGRRRPAGPRPRAGRTRVARARAPARTRRRRPPRGPPRGRRRRGRGRGAATGRSASGGAAGRGSRRSRRRSRTGSGPPPSRGPGGGGGCARSPASSAISSARSIGSSASIRSRDLAPRRRAGRLVEATRRAGRPRCRRRATSSTDGASPPLAAVEPEPGDRAARWPSRRSRR